MNITKNQPSLKWVHWGIINLAIVALYGSLMRYKIAYEFPFFEQKNLLHAHSHFAFSGWVSHMLYACLGYIMYKELGKQVFNKYRQLILINLLCSFGMLYFFTLEGYKFASILFSTLSVLIAISYAIIYIKESKKLHKNNPSKIWAIYGLLFNIISSFGPFLLAFMMANKAINHNIYLGSVYYYLHFQYSGWFFFGSMAIALSLVPKPFADINKLGHLFAITVIPTFFLSILWAKLPMWLYIITVIATIVQLYAWFRLVSKLFLKLHLFKTKKYPKWILTFFYAAVFAMSIKVVLQMISVIPSLSQLVFGFRPIVIAYLHLVLLGIFSLFLIGYSLANEFITITRVAKIGAFTFLIGVILNESFLGIQGLAAFSYTPIPHINGLLLIAALVLFIGAVTLAISQYMQKDKKEWIE